MYRGVKSKNTPREKWLAVLKNFIHTNLGEITTDLF